MLLEYGKTCARGFCLWAGWVGTDDLFVQLLRVGDIVLSLFELGGLEQFLRLIPAASCKGQTNHHHTSVHPSCHHVRDRSHRVCIGIGHAAFDLLGLTRMIHDG